MAIAGAAAEFIVLDQQPFNVVEAPSFENLLRVAANDASLGAPSRHDVSTKVSAMAKEAEGKLRDMLKGTHPALTTDCWTSTSGVSRAAGNCPSFLFCSRAFDYTQAKQHANPCT